MSRDLRDDFEAGVHHVWARGNRRQLIFVENADRHIDLALLGKCVERAKWSCLAYCLDGQPRPSARGDRAPEPERGRFERVIGNRCAPSSLPSRLLGVSAAPAAADIRLIDPASGASTTLVEDDYVRLLGPVGDGFAVHGDRDRRVGGGGGRRDRHARAAAQGRGVGRAVRALRSWADTDGLRVARTRRAA